MARLLCLLVAVASAELVSPIEKVTRLLQDMKTTLETEQKEDDELYDQLSCWCTTNEKEKTAAVTAAKKAIDGLTADIEEYGAKSAELKSTIERLKKEIDDDQAALDTASAIRAKENGEFSASEKELMESIQSVTSAVTTLSKHNSFLQVASASAPLKAVRAALEKHATVLAPPQRRSLASFLAQPAQSKTAEIFAILKQMKETFETNLSAEQKEEMAAQSEFNQLKSSKTREIKAGKAQQLDKTSLLAETDEAMATAKHDLIETENALTADQKFLIDMEKRCEAGDADYVERRQMRAVEIAAVSEALGILSGDESRDLFTSTLSFAQRTVHTQKRAKASAVLRAAARKSGSSALVSLANRASIDAFAKVVSAIDEMTTSLKKEMEDEVKHQRFCTKELTENEAGQEEKKDKIEDLSAEIEDNTATVDTLTKEIAELQKQVAEMKVQVKRASEDREKANKIFQQAVADQRATQNVLNKVYKRLSKVYAAKPKTPAAKSALLQLGHKQAPPPPAFKDYKKSEGGGGVLSLVQKIIAEALSLEKETLVAEQSAQKDYTVFVADSTKSIDADNRSIAAKAKAKARLENDLVTAAADKKATIADLEMLGSYEGQLHLSCDYVLQNFDVRQEARGQEVDALANAKAILSGADFA
jgi:predicted nuclease with TOPRIM domain